MGEARGDKAGDELCNGESKGNDEKERPCLCVGDAEILLYERHERRKKEASQEIQEEECGNEEDRSGSCTKRFWNGT